MIPTTDRLARLLALIPYIQQNQGVSLEDVAHYAHSSPQGVIDDLGRVMLCGVPPYMPDDYVGVYVEGGRVYIRFAEHIRRPVSLTAPEAMTLQVMLAALPAGRADSPLRRSITSIEGKVAALLSQDEQETLASVTDRIDPASPESETIGRKLDRIHEAIDRGLKLALNYFRPAQGTLSPRVVRPYALIDHMGQWYLIAHCEERHEERTFRIDRIRNLALLSQTYTIPDSFDPSAYRTSRMFTGSATYTLSVRFHPDIARQMLERYSDEPSRVESDGSVVVEIRAGGVDWAIPWALKYASRAEVLAPAKIRQKMGQALDAILERYGAAAEPE